MASWTAVVMMGGGPATTSAASATAPLPRGEGLRRRGPQGQRRRRRQEGLQQRQPPAPWRLSRRGEGPSTSGKRIETKGRAFAGLGVLTGTRSLWRFWRPLGRQRPSWQEHAWRRLPTRGRAVFSSRPRSLRLGAGSLWGCCKPTAAPTTPVALPAAGRAVCLSRFAHRRQVFVAALAASRAPTASSAGTRSAAYSLRGDGASLQGGGQLAARGSVHQVWRRVLCRDAADRHKPLALFAGGRTFRWTWRPHRRQIYVDALPAAF